MKYNYKIMDSIPKDESAIKTAERLGCTRQAVYDMRKKYIEEKRVNDLEKDLRACKAKLKALSEPK